jgi:hypothetical protein
LTVTSTAAGDREISAASHIGTFVGAALRFTSGAAQDQRVLIQADDGTTFTLVDLPFAPVAPGDTFVVERPGSILVNTTGGIQFNGGNMALKDVKLEAGIVPFIGGVQCVNAENVEITGGRFAVLNFSLFSPSSFHIGFLDPSPFNPFVGALCGIYVHDTAISINRYSRLAFAGGSPASGVFENCFIPVNNGGVFNMSPVAFINSEVNLGDGTFNAFGGAARAVWDGTLGGNGVSGGFGSLINMGNLDMVNMPGDAIFLDRGAKAQTGDVGGIAGNLGLGLNIKNGSSAVADNDGGGGSATTVSGAGGDLQVGANPVTTYAALAGTTGQGETDGTGPTLNRFTIIQ